MRPYFKFTLTALLLLAFISSPCRAQAGAWSSAQIEMASPAPISNTWSAAPALIGTSAVSETAMRMTTPIGGSWFGVLPYLRLTEPPLTSPHHQKWATLAIDFPWLVDYHWESGQIPPAGPHPTTADLLNAVGLGSRVNANDVDALNLGPNMAAPAVISKFVDDIIAACRHHAFPVASPSTPVGFDPFHPDWAFDHYGQGSSPAAALWLNALKSGTIVDGTPTTGLASSRIAEVALAYTAPDATEFGAAVRRMNEIEDVGYEVWMHLLIFAPDDCVTTTHTYSEDAAVPEIDSTTAAQSIRFSVTSAISWSTGPSLDPSYTIEPDPKGSSDAGSGSPQVYIPIPMSSINLLAVEIPLAGGGSTTITSSRLPFEPGFMVNTPPLSQLHPTLDWSLSYPSSSPWPGFPLAPMANPVASGIIQ